MFSTFINIRSSSLIIFFWLAGLFAFGQVDQIDRLEIPMREENVELENPKILSLDSTGLLSYRRLITKEGEQIELMLLDTALQIKWRGYFPASQGMSLTAVKAADDVAYFLFKSRVAADFVIVTVSLTTGNYSVLPIKNFIPFNYFEMVITQKAVLIGGYFNYRPLVLYVDMQQLKARILPGFFNEIGEITQLQADADGTVDVVLIARNQERAKSVWIRRYDADGNLIRTTLLTPDKKMNFIFGRMAKTDDNRTMVVGVYGRFTEYSRGIFVSEISPTGEYETRYYNFADLKNFFSYMRSRREQRVKERIERRKVKGKKIKFNYRLLVHELITHNNQLVMLGEAFYPHYSNRSRFNSPGLPSFYSYSLNRNDLVFDGFQYTHAVVIGFDSNGNLKWDNSFEIKDVRTFQLDQYVRMGRLEDRLVMLYSFENSIRSKVISGNDVLEGKTSNTMKTNYRFDMVKDHDTEMSKLDYWYGKYFYVSGVQTIRSSIDRSVSRRVFFINKLSLK